MTEKADYWSVAALVMRGRKSDWRRSTTTRTGSERRQAGTTGVGGDQAALVGIARSGKAGEVAVAAPLVVEMRQLYGSRRDGQDAVGNPRRTSKMKRPQQRGLRPFVAHGAKGGLGCTREPMLSGPMTLVTILRWCRCLANPCSSIGCVATGRSAGVGCVAGRADTFGRRAAFHVASHEAHRLHRAVRIWTVKGQIARCSPS
jgi:hypothetical protein